LADKLRVHALSKELGVTSKAILEKCKVEGVEGVTNHMSTVSAGLAETVREWFSAQHQGTAVETAAKVDLAKVRTKRKTTRKRKTKEEKEKAEKAEQDEDKEVPLPETAESPTLETKPKAAPRHKQKVAAKTPTESAEPTESVVSEAPPSGAAAEVPVAAPPTEQTLETLKPAAQVAKPKPAPKSKPKSKPVKPAGPQNIPVPAQMKGPKVVGFAKPDPIYRPVSRGSSPSQAGPAEVSSTDAPSARRGGRGRAGGRDEEDTKKVRSRANPRRSRSSMVDVGERLREWNDRDLIERQERLKEATGRGIHTRRAREKATGRGPVHVAGRKTEAQVTEPVIVYELCAATGIGLNQLFPKLKNEHDLIINRNSVIPMDIAHMVMLEFGIELTVVKPQTELDRLKQEHEGRSRNNMQLRPPVVTMLGHVDHGKTSLLDMVRKTSVVSGEAGGITQHIGAYRVERGDLSVTFLDTPGHEAFTAMRARGANMTDVVVLVIAADDGVMPQTIEAINHAKAAKVPIVIALNKIDLPGVDLNKVYGQLAEMELTPTEWGGDTDVIKTSATTGQGIEDLIAHLVTLSDLLELKADLTVPAAGAVIEAQMQPAVGSVARLLVQEGTLKRGDFLVCGPAAGRVRNMRDDRGRTIKSAAPGVPVEVTGLDTVPNAGDLFYRVESLQRAKSVAEEVSSLRRQQQLTQLQKPRTLDDLFQERASGLIPELNLILKADVQGSIDALVKMLSEIPSDEVKLNFLHTGIGGISESDVVLAMASGAMIVGFNVTADSSVQRLADAEGVDVRLYRVIYEVGDDIRKALEGLLPTDKSEEFRGRAEVREIFRVSRVGVIAGCMVTEGMIGRSHMVRVIRDSQIIVPTEDDVTRGRHRPIHSLRRFKDDAREVRVGMECGLRVEGFDDVKPGDVVEAYEVIETARTLA